MLTEPWNEVKKSDIIQPTQFFSTMTYQVLINGNSILGGNIMGAAIVVGLLLLILLILLVFLWRKLRENDALKYEFITIIAHKFRTPLTTTKWLVEGLMTDETDSHNREKINDIRQATEKLISMTGSLIELTDTDSESKASYTLEQINLCDLVRTVSSVYRRQFKEKNLAFDAICEDENVFANVDRVRIEFVLQTLLENASTYTPPGRQVQVTVGHSGRKAMITVADNGIGIDRADIPHIFTKFYRTKNAQVMDTDGFGVGLFLAQSIARRHKGKIHVFSEGLNRGSAFTIVLPAVKK
jgi:signal transduction histidine kinase